MEWDDVETAGIIQRFESSAISALVELRQKHWKECTAVINEVRKMVSQLRSDLDSGLARINSENVNLKKELEQYRCMIEGKDLELMGLRQQLRSVNLTNPSLQKPETEAANLEAEEAKRQDEKNNRKRARFNLSTTSLESADIPPADSGEVAASVHRKPSEKRLCVATPNGQVAVDVSRSKSRTERSNHSATIPETQNAFLDDGEVSADSRTLTEGSTPEPAANQVLNVKQEHEENQQGSMRRRRLSDPVSHHPIGLATFSPPSRFFDASLAIRNAVNHLDLANYEPSLIASVVDGNEKKTNPSSAASRHHVHKKTCRHYQSPTQKKQANATNRKTRAGPPAAVDLLSDATGVDLTFPSISSVALATPAPTTRRTDESDKDLMPPPSVTPSSVVRTTRRNTRRVDMPSVGTSPTSQADRHPQGAGSQAPNGEQGKGPGNSMIKCVECAKYHASLGRTPQSISMRLRAQTHHKHLDDTNKSNGKNANEPGDKVGASSKSTPEGFWSFSDLDALPNRAAPTSRQQKEAALNRLRRRRPLQFSKPLH